jgi:hypothetical protein
MEKNGEWGRKGVVDVTKSLTDIKMSVAETKQSLEMIEKTLVDVIERL